MEKITQVVSLAILMVLATIIFQPAHAFTQDHNKIQTALCKALADKVALADQEINHYQNASDFTINMIGNENMIMHWECSV